MSKGDDNRTPPAEGPPDAELVRRVQQGDAGAYEDLVRRHHARIYGLVYNMTSNREDAEDLTQEIFLKAYRSLSRFQGRSSFYTWLYRIALNMTINYRKKRNRKQALSLDEMVGEVKTDPAYTRLHADESPFRNANISEFQKKLNSALQSLSDKHRTVVVLHDIQGLPHNEIAKIVGCSVGTVRSRLFYARQILQGKLAEFAP
ncbi:RNA polymerase sigma factor [Kiritimatiella glycovorans]|uniref:Sigma-24 n=1 Tax=Kiritimatiella glycovorans TaxID=1307763 RepID=A0A0G3ELZ2_9BACT|nr:sigma-70 family RNA polymerase sigma factor [Kiritimatiella glycovorans]AKJ65179.1 Sigma-24 [Kiritimatiella glycovorans]